MNSISIVALRGCKLCEALIGELGKRDVYYKIIDADTNSAFCDRLEEALGVYNYPIAIVEVKRSRYVYYYYLVSDPAKVKVTKLSDYAYLCGCYSIDDMIDNILN
jgi:hypothetical protein